MRKIFSIVLVIVALVGCRTTRVTETSSTTTVIKDTTVNVAIPKDSAKVEINASELIAKPKNDPKCDSIATSPIAQLKDTIIWVKSNLSKATLSIKDGKVKLQVDDGQGKKDSLKVGIKGGIRETTNNSEKKKVVEKNGWFVPAMILLLCVIILLALVGGLWFYLKLKRNG